MKISSLQKMTDVNEYRSGKYCRACTLETGRMCRLICPSSFCSYLQFDASIGAGEGVTSAEARVVGCMVVGFSSRGFVCFASRRSAVRSRLAPPNRNYGYKNPLKPRMAAREREFDTLPFCYRPEAVQMLLSAPFAYPLNR